ncbi:unnamed protein product [Meganyctiphanes norvegica]|uniref:Secreted protein n=1 Tax=Meganyctiphanes norvegica TaxID=48144 RepID=A0AAV2QJ66_MEGNR
MARQVVAVLVYFLVVFANGKAVRENSLNYYLDTVLANAQIIILENGFDPTTLPNATTGFNDTILGVTWHGEAALYDGWLHGISTLYRSGDADFVLSDNIISGISGTFGLGAMEGHYNCLAKFQNLGPIADVTLSNEGGSIIFTAALNHQTCRFEMSSFDLTHITNFHVEIHGLGPLNWILDIVMGLVINTVKTFLKWVIEEPIRNIVNQVMALVDLGPLGPIVGCETQSQGPAVPWKGIPGVPHKTNANSN